jgi:hypothetical protein
VNYLREFRDHLALIGDSAPVRDFHEQTVACRRPRRSSAPASAPAPSSRCRNTPPVPPG